MNEDEHEKQINEIRNGKDVYICVPHRLYGLLEAQSINLDHDIFIVLDQMDRMLDLDFETQIRNILDNFKSIK